MERRGFLTIEACMLIMIFVAALLAIFGYFHKAIQGHWRTNSDTFYDEQFDYDRSSRNYDINKGPTVRYKNNALYSNRKSENLLSQGKFINGW